MTTIKAPSKPRIKLKVVRPYDDYPPAYNETAALYKSDQRIENGYYNALLEIDASILLLARLRAAL